MRGEMVVIVVVVVMMMMTMMMMANVVSSLDHFSVRLSFCQCVGLHVW